VKGNRLRVCRKRFSGPLVTVQVVADAEEAVAVANDTSSGLAAMSGVRTRRVPSQWRRGLRAGTVLVTTGMVRERGAPFGGFGASGVDREGGRWSLDFYSEAKAIVTRSLAGASIRKEQAA
jgi:acyl-CoA reductase-like NAD-dependent aldehyde dehydrogenase